MEAQQPFDPINAFAELGRINLNETDLDGVLHKVAELSKRTVAGVDEASVTLIRGKNTHTAAFTGSLALSLDERQYEGGGGPCLQAAATTATLSLPDLTQEERWPNYVRHAINAGILSSLSVGLPVHDNVAGALNLYSRKPDAFDDDAVVLAQTFSGYAAVALANAHIFDATVTLAQQMQAAMEHRAVIEQAKGIVMAGRRCGPDEAFVILSRLSQDSNRKLRDVARALVAQTNEQARGE
ncbi:GAF and ANTAR domain-containing protein [Actinoplanes sp. NPDC049118]|uniref:GAF and ANTAR domain-containing protein n=1 Tax=Actinoplanes sp. NPDC049118 TaxID=3155769 RepID=UPI0033CA62F9